MQEKNVKKLKKQREIILTKIRNMDNFCRGTVVLLKQKCTNKTCSKCISGEKHPQYYLTRSKNSKSSLTFVGNKNEETVRTWTNNYKQLKEYIEELTDINIQLLKLKII